MPFKKFNKILIVRTDRIGDVVLTTPVIKALRKAYPAAHIAMLVTPSTYDLVNGNPYLDEVLVDDRRGQHQGLIGSLQLARDIRQRGFDAVFIFHTKRRYNWACYLAGVPERFGYKNDKFGFLLNQPIKDSRHLGRRHEAEYCLDVLKAVGIECGDLDLFVPAQKEAEEWAGRWIQEQGVGPFDMVVFHPGASDATKCWPAKNFALLNDILHQRYLLKTVLIGTGPTQALAREIANLSNSPMIDLTGQTSLAQTVSLLRRSRLLVSNDSGPVHIASAAGSTVISLFLRDQPGINHERWRPLGPKAYVLANHKGEEIVLSAQGSITSGKLDSITVDEVADLIEQIFQKDNQATFLW